MEGYQKYVNDKDSMRLQKKTPFTTHPSKHYLG